MTKRPFYDLAVHVGSGGYTLVALEGQRAAGAGASRTLTTDAPVGHWTDAVTAVVGPVSGRRPRAVLLIASDWWIGVPIPIGSMGSRGDDAIRYEVEAQLGHSFEDLYIGIVRHSDGAMVFAVFRQPVDEVVARCAEAGIDAWTAHPTALLALRRWQVTNKMSTDALVWPSQEGEQFSLWDLRGGRVNGWQVAYGAEDLASRIRSFGFHDEETLGVASVAPPKADDRQEAIGVTRWVEDIAEEEAALRYLEEHSGRDASCTAEVPLIKSSRFPAAGPAWVSWVCGAAALAALIVGTLWSAARLEAAAERLHAAQDAAYRRAFPGQPAPASVLRALQAQWDQSTRLDTTGTFDPERSALDRLRALTSQLPHELTPVITELRIDQEGFDMAGESPSHVAAARLAESLGSGGHFVVGDPQTTVASEGKFRFLISAHFTDAGLQ